MFHGIIKKHERTLYLLYILGVEQREGDCI